MNNFIRTYQIENLSTQLESECFKTPTPDFEMLPWGSWSVGQWPSKNKELLDPGHTEVTSRPLFGLVWQSDTCGNTVSAVVLLVIFSSPKTNTQRVDRKSNYENSLVGSTLVAVLEMGRGQGWGWGWEPAEDCNRRSLDGDCWGSVYVEKWEWGVGAYMNESQVWKVEFNGHGIFK